jgi:hypothetical protein
MKSRPQQGGNKCELGFNEMKYSRRLWEVIFLLESEFLFKNLMIALLYAIHYKKVKKSLLITAILLVYVSLCVYEKSSQKVAKWNKALVDFLHDGK